MSDAPPLTRPDAPSGGPSGGPSGVPSDGPPDGPAPRVERPRRPPIRWGELAVSVGLPFVIGRVLVGLGWLLARAVADSSFGVRPEVLTQGLVAWDGTYYRDIGIVGYEHLPADTLRFFPLYPLLAKGLAFAFDDNQGLALVVVANLAALALLCIVRALMRTVPGVEPAAADRAVWAVAFFPGAFVFVWAYSEALFLALGMGALLLARRRRWLLAAALGFLAALTRPLGLLLVVPLAIEAWSAVRRPDDLLTARLSAAFGASAPVLGTATYLLWVDRAWGRPGLPYTVQAEFRGESVNPLSRIWTGLGDLVGPERFGDGLHIPFAVLFVVLLVLAWRTLPRSLGAYAAVVVVTSLSVDNLNSLERYALNAVPLAMALAVWASTPRRERLAMAVGANGVMALAALAWLGLYVP